MNFRSTISRMSLDCTDRLSEVGKVGKVIGGGGVGRQGACVLIVEV